MVVLKTSGVEQLKQIVAQEADGSRCSASGSQTQPQPLVQSSTSAAPRLSTAVMSTPESPPPPSASGQ